MDCRICQTFTASPAEPGDLPEELALAPFGPLIANESRIFLIVKMILAASSGSQRMAQERSKSLHQNQAGE
jgi:hypothetical protein